MPTPDEPEVGSVSNQVIGDDPASLPQDAPLDAGGVATGEGRPSAVTIKADSVGTVRLDKQLEPTQQAGLLLAGAVGIVTTLAILAIIAAWVAKAPWMGVPSGLAQMEPSKAKAVIDNLKILNDLSVDSAVKMFDTIVARSLLPVFTAILGYIFGTRASRSGN